MKLILFLALVMKLHVFVTSFDAARIDEMHQSLTIECKQRFLNIQKDPSKRYCPEQLDSAFGCWPPTPSGYNATIPCPNVFYKSGNVTQECSSNGEWVNFGAYIRKNTKASTQCIDQSFEDLQRNLNALIIRHEVATEKDLQNLLSRKYHATSIALMVKIIYWICISTCIFSLIILAWLYPLANDRINLHRNLIATNLLLCITALMKDWDIIQSDQRIGCNILYVIYAYLFLTSFVWMLNEGVHQFRAIYFVFVPNMTKFRYYLLFGYGFPAIVVFIIYLPLLIKYPPSEERCWNTEIRYKWDYIPFGTAHLVIGINVSIMIYLLYIIFTKLKSSKYTTNKKSWKSCRSFFILLTLLGGQFMFTLYYPKPDFPYPDKHAIRMAYVINFFISSPSFFICLFQVFLSKDVYVKLKKKIVRLKLRFDRYQEDHTISRMSSTKTMKSSVSWTKDDKENNGFNDVGINNHAYDETIQHQFHERRQSFLRHDNGTTTTIAITKQSNKQSTVGCDNESFI